jgi:hypothetical protein
MLRLKAFSLKKKDVIAESPLNIITRAAMPTIKVVGRYCPAYQR